VKRDDIDRGGGGAPAPPFRPLAPALHGVASGHADPLRPARGILLGTALGLVLWATLFGLMWVALRA
jgi:hypothetical protein